MGLFADAFAGGWLVGQLDTAAGVTLTLSRGAERTADVAAIRGKVAYLSHEEIGGAVRVELNDRDYLILVEDYQIDGEAVTPREGDRYQETGSDGVYELQTPDNGEKAWRYTDNTEVQYRLHVKRVV